MTGNRRVRPCRPACRRGVRAVKLEPAGMAPTKIASAVYEIQYPAQMRQDVRHAVQAYNALSQALVEKKGKKRENEADGSQAVSPGPGTCGNR